MGCTPAKRGLVLMAVVVVAVAALPPGPAHAQFSPRGILGAIASPFRHLLGHFGHFRHYHPGYHDREHSAAASALPDKAPNPAAGTRLGLLGPPAWPAAYADVIGYVFWPQDYAQETQDRGFDVIAETISGPLRAPVASARRASTTGAASAAGAGCDVAAGPQDWPQAQIEKTVALSDQQKQALGKVQARFEQSTKNLKVDCRDANEIAPTDRLGSLIDAIWAIRDTDLSLREALREFDDTLTADQRNAFAASGSTQSAQTQGVGKDEADKAMQACAAQNVGEAERMIKEIEQRTHPNKEQSAGLDNLHKASTNMAKLLAGSCAKPAPNDLLGRLDAIDEQLTTLNYAATTVQIAFDDFYDKLDDQQQARLQSTGR